MPKLLIRPQWLLATPSGMQDMPHLLDLLVAIRDTGSIRAAAARLDVSYRHAWGLIRHAGEALGSPLVAMSRGRAATLTIMGQSLVDAHGRIETCVVPVLDRFTADVNAQIARARRRDGVLRIDASHDYAMELLLAHLQQAHSAAALRNRGSMEALASLAAERCDVAGFHVPSGPMQDDVLKFYARWLDPARQVLVNLAVRRQGLMVPRGNPKSLRSVSDFALPGLRIAVRQFGSGTRILLDLLLGRAGLTSASIVTCGTGEFMHSGVAAYVANGVADAGLGVEEAARRYGLDFIHLLDERYFLACASEFVDAPPMRSLRAILASESYRAGAAAIAGVDVSKAGSAIGVLDAFGSIPIPGGTADLVSTCREQL